MYISLFTDEFGEDVYKVLPVAAQWGMEYVDFRGLINGKGIENQTEEELRTLKKRWTAMGLRPVLFSPPYARCICLAESESQKRWKSWKGSSGPAKFWNVKKCAVSISGNMIRTIPPAENWLCGRTS